MRQFENDLTKITDEMDGHPLDNGNNIWVKCSNCNATLAQLWINNMAKINNNVVARCPHCGDKSFVVEFTGGFYLGTCKETQIVDTEIDVRDNTMYILLKTQKPEAQT